MASRTHTIGRMRLLSQKLVGTLPATPEQAVRALLAMQAQDLDSVLWSIGVRARRATVADVGRAMTTGSIVRSWPLRGTLHVVCADDLPWLLEALGPRIVATTAARRAELGLDERTLANARDVAQKRLAGGHAFTRGQMLAAFTAAGIAVNDQRGYHLLFNLSLTGTLCSGPSTAKEPTFALLSEWVKRPRRLDRDQALGELARRYVEGHGPATPNDLVGWAKLTASDAKRGVEVAGRALTSIDVHGVRYLLAAGAQDGFAAVETEVASSVLALPGFDEFVLGYKDRDAILDPAFADRIVPGGNGVFRPTIVVGGHVEGVWRRKKSANAMVIESEPFTKLSKTATRGFASAATSYGRFFATPVRVAEARR